jgi:Zn-dependent peptidase ImmA (M78 family)
MPRPIARRILSPEVRALVRSTKASSPEEAIRGLAREVLDTFLNTFPDDGPAVNVEALASFRSIKLVSEPPSFSEDAELVPNPNGRVRMRVNRDRPVTRQRFSIGHEVGHTLFPGYETQVQCRKPRTRDWHNPSDILEYLCDVASSEFLLPLERFRADLDAKKMSAERLQFLAGLYNASPEATVRRYIDLTEEPVTAVFFRWKHKPADGVRKSMPGQRNLPGIVSRQPERKLRVEYAVCNSAFDSLRYHIPKHKSVTEESVILQAATMETCMDAGREHLDLGAFSGWFRVHALPIYTPESHLGPEGESSVVAILQPASKRRAK